MAEGGWVYLMYLSWKSVAPAPYVPASAVAAPSSAYTTRKYLVFLFLISHFTVQGNRAVSHLKGKKKKNSQKAQNPGIRPIEVI